MVAMKKILLTFLFFIYAVYASEFFGTSGTGTNYDSGNNNYVFGNGSATYTCPGSGQFNIVSLSAFCKNTGGGSGAFSMAVYSADGSTLIGHMEHKYVLTDTQTTGAYRGMDTSITQLSTLTGGENYIISINVSTANVQNRYVSGSSGVFKYNTGASYYDDGWPSSITLSSNYTLEFEVRCEVEAATEPCTTATIASIKITDTVYNSGKWKNTVTGSYDSIKKFGTWPDSTALIAYTTKDSISYKVKKPFTGICSLIVYSCAGTGLDTALDTINFVSGLRLDKYFPDTGKVGDTVLLIGHGFKNQQDSSTISIKDSVPTIVFWHNDTIRMVVPNVDTGYVDSTIVYDGYVADTLFNAFRVLGDYVIPRCTLSITLLNGTVTKNPDTSIVDSGEAIGIKVAANVGYTFSGWTGDTTTSADTIYYVLNESKSITANFTVTSQSTTGTKQPYFRRAYRVNAYRN